VSVVTVGPARSRDALRQALAMGCDDATLVIADDKTSGLDVAKALAAVVKEAKPDVVLCGKQASDDDQGLVGPALAEALGWPHVGMLTKITAGGDGVELWREIEAPRGVESTAAGRRPRAQERERAALPEPARDHEGEKEGDPEKDLASLGVTPGAPRAESSRWSRRRSGWGKDPQGRRRREGSRGRARAPAARRGEGPVKILVVAERNEGKLRRVSAEIAAKAKTFGDTEVIEVTRTDRYHPVAHANAVAAHAKSSSADVVLTGATLNGRDLAARVAAKLGWAMPRTAPTLRRRTARSR